MSHRSLDDRVRLATGAVKMARSAQEEGAAVSSVPPEYSNWRDEQRAWRTTVALLDLTHHMTDLSVKGKDAVRVFSDLGVNGFETFKPGRAKQLVCCNADGYFIGDGILFYLDENQISFLGPSFALNWVHYHAETGGYAVSIQRDNPTAINPTGQRELYRFQIQGPYANDLLSKATGGVVPEIKFFHLGQLAVQGREVRVLRHGMAGAPGLELFGPWKDMEEIRSTLVRAGKEFGLRQVGMKAYPTTTLESGWIPHPVPAIFTGDSLRAYREWLPETCAEGNTLLAGSYESDDIADYYFTPYELGYGPLIKFDHDFVGRKALEGMAERMKRRKVTLLWNADDVLAVMRTLFDCDDPCTFLEFPWGSWATWHYDKVMSGNLTVGRSMHCGYSYNERAMLSLAVVDADVALGSEVTVVWGSRDSGPPVVEKHRQAEIRAIVSPCPFSAATRNSYAAGWRSRATSVS